MGSTCVLPVELHASIWEHSERAGHLQGGLHGARHRYGSIGTIKASTPYEVRWGYCTVPSVRGPLCVEFRDNFQLLVSNLNRGAGARHTRANRTRHTTSSSTQPHAQQQLTNAPQKNLRFTRTHTPPERRTMPKINRRAHRPAVSRHSRAHTHQDTHSTATPTRERARQWNHRLRELHRPLRQRLRPLPPLPLHLPTCRSRPTSSSWRRARPAVLERTSTGFTTEKRRSSMESVTRLRERREKSPSPRRHYVQRPSRDNP